MSTLRMSLSTIIGGLTGDTPACRRASFHASMETSLTVIAVDTLTGMDDVGISVAERDGNIVSVLLAATEAHTDETLMARVNGLCVEYKTSRVVTAGMWRHR